jgi:hypothetical protein
MSNNIYDILKKMQNLEAPKQNLTESKKAKPDYIDIDKDGDKKEPMKKAAKEKSKGAVAEAVARVEQQLAGKYQGWKKINEEEKMIRKVIPVGVIDGPGGYDEAQKRIQDYEAGKINKRGEPLPPIEDRSKPAEKPKTNVGRKEIDEEGPDDQGSEENRFRHFYHHKNNTIFTTPEGDRYDYDDPDQRERWLDLYKKEFDMPTPHDGGYWRKGPDGDEAMVEGEVEESGLQAYLGKKKYGEQGMRALQKAGREGASKEKMARIRARHDKMDEGIANFDDNYGSPEIDRVMSRQGSEDFSKKSDRQRELDAVERLGAMMHDEREQRAYKDRTAPGIINKVKDYFDYNKPNPAYGPKFKDKQGTEYDYPYGNPKTKSYNEDMLSPDQKKFAALAEPRDKITYADKIAGAKKGKKTEGNKFSGNLMKARAKGLKQADLDGDGDMERVTPGKSNMREGWEEMQAYLDKKRGPESKGSAGKKAGTRYGGSAQKDDDAEETDGEGKPVEKKKGRPKGTGGGAKFNFKKPKD